MTDPDHELREELAARYPSALASLQQLDRPTLELLALSLAVSCEEERGAYPASADDVESALRGELGTF